MKLLHDYGFRPELAFLVASHSKKFFKTISSTIKITYFDNGVSHEENVRNKVSFGKAFLRLSCMVVETPCYRPYMANISYKVSGNAAKS